MKQGDRVRRKDGHALGTYYGKTEYCYVGTVASVDLYSNMVGIFETQTPVYMSLLEVVGEMMNVGDTVRRKDGRTLGLDLKTSQSCFVGTIDSITGAIVIIKETQVCQMIGGLEVVARNASYAPPGAYSAYENCQIADLPEGTLPYMDNKSLLEEQDCTCSVMSNHHQFDPLHEETCPRYKKLEGFI